MIDFHLSFQISLILNIQHSFLLFIIFLLYYKHTHINLYVEAPALFAMRFLAELKAEGTRYPKEHKEFPRGLFQVIEVAIYEVNAVLDILNMSANHEIISEVRFYYY